ncbi:MAG: response regulator transcription factor [Gammaproteobacteria bacterium]|nr:response regulator transcription factor [Gammaproteobacteria bacterium]
MRILVAEDELDLANALKRVLEISKYDVDLALNGLEALNKATESRTRYDAIIMDVMMPKMDGFSVVSELRKLGFNTPILILTARGETDDKVIGLDSGADDYLTKPFQIKELLARIRALLRRKSDQQSHDTYSFGDLVLFKNTYTLQCGENEVRLTNKEFKMMECFIEYSNSLLSTEKLMDLVWDYDSDAEINVVWAYISALRKKLKDLGSKYTINAVRGVGYRLGEK